MFFVFPKKERSVTYFISFKSRKCPKMLPSDPQAWEYYSLSFYAKSLSFLTTFKTGFCFLRQLSKKSSGKEHIHCITFGGSAHKSKNVSRVMIWLSINR